MKDNECSYFLSLKLQSIEQRLAHGMQALADNPATMANLRYEAMAFLLDMGRPRLVQQAWINNMLDQQMSNGGWGQSIGDAYPSCPHHSCRSMGFAGNARPSCPQRAYDPSPHTKPLVNVCFRGWTIGLIACINCA